MAEAAAETTRRKHPLDQLLDEPAPPEGQHKTVDAKMKVADEPDTADLPPPAAKPKGWFDMDEAPDSGKAIWLMSPDGEFVEGLWRHTRRFDNCGGRTSGIWREIGLWAYRNSGGKPIPWEPVCWKPI